MSNTQKNVPELRFPGFEDEWEEKTFGEFTKTNQGLQIAINDRETEYKEGLYFYITNEFLKPNSKTKYFIKNPPKSVIANEEDILMTRTGNTGKVITGVFGAFHNNFFKISFDKNLYDRLFLFELLKSSKINNRILSLAGTSTIPDLNHSDFYSIRTFLPNKNEQQKIGDFFSKLDKQIELEEKKLKLLEQQKKGYMQKIFSQELRFKDENGNDYPEWILKKIEDVAKVNKGFTPSTKNNKYWNEENQNWLSIAGMTQKYLYKGNKGITEEGASNHFKVKENTLIMSFKLTLGKLAIVKEPLFTNEAICHFEWKIDDVDTEYMYYYLNSINISTFGAQAVKGITLNNDSINSIIVKLPTIEEQRKISSTLIKIEQLIDNQSNKVALLQKRKQGFLQKVFI
ncbi:restriction endonuclease subunit S [Staphylococcus pasteuri]|uniref:restriction endonuclease subunit S n=1 Tax=Staphylococcus pasteuri TaxID=45972 RepID=UPI000F820115|nr:restriction endonuclease subunit S [Staphylococcus pasteuri]MEB6612488.1 restriction endonuclease subunit S [Staphylococcus pasteuri]QQN54031.1 restriction endonuclease subunit S [Staphylococcus pasteuri]RTX76029.1 restriction endonuclease subunit S [Staphylococcus pasteuri]